MQFISLLGGWYDRSAKGWWNPGEPMPKELQRELYYQISSSEQQTIRLGGEWSFSATLPFKLANKQKVEGDHEHKHGFQYQ